MNKKILSFLVIMVMLLQSICCPVYAMEIDAEPDIAINDMDIDLESNKNNEYNEIEELESNIPESINLNEEDEPVMNVSENDTNDADLDLNLQNEEIEENNEIEIGEEEIENDNTIVADNTIYAYVQHSVMGPYADRNKKFTYHLTATLNGMPLTDTYNYTVSVYDNSIRDYVDSESGQVAFDSEGQIAFRLKDKENFKITGLPVGTQASIVRYVENADEDGDEEYVFSQVDFSSEQKIYFAVSETHLEKSELVVTHTVTGDGADQSKKFVYTLTATANGSPVTGSYIYTGPDSIKQQINFNKEGKVSFQLSGSQTISISRLPYDTKFSIERTSYSEDYTFTERKSIANERTTLKLTETKGNPNDDTTKQPIDNAIIENLKDVTFTGTKITQNITVICDGKTLKEGTDYTTTYQNNVKAGTATVIIKGKGNYTGTITKKFIINKAKQKITVKTKQVNLKAKTLKKKQKKIKLSKVIKIKKAKGNITYKKIQGHKNISVNKKGTITIAKGTKKGVYKVRIKLTADGNDNYKKTSVKFNVRIRIK